MLNHVGSIWLVVVLMLLPDNETEDQGPEYEPGVPPLLGGLADGDDAQEEEYDAVHEGGQRLDSVLD